MEADHATVELNYYLRRFFDPYDKERGAHPFYLKTHHSFYQNFSKSWNADTAKFLEYGGGPTVYSLISAAPFFSEITFSDYQQSNLDAVVAWRDSQEGGHDWTSYFKYTISELEGNDSDEMVHQRQEEARTKCKIILRGDLHAKDILFSDSLPPEDFPFQKKFDVVSSNFCCDVAANTVEEYHTNVRRLGELVKPGGYLIGMASLGVTYWYTSYGNERKFHITIDENDVKKAYGNAGFNIVYTDIHHLSESARHLIGDTKSNMFVVGRK